MGEAERGRRVTTSRIALAALLVLAVFWVVAKNGSGAHPPPAPITLKDEVQNLPAGGWKAFPFYASGGELNIDLRVVHGNPIDFS